MNTHPRRLSVYTLLLALLAAPLAGLALVIALPFLGWCVLAHTLWLRATRPRMAEPRPQKPGEVRTW